MRKAVIRGIVETMDDRQLQARSHSLSEALDRLSVARGARLAEIPVLTLDRDEPGELRSPRRRALMRFADRARAAASAQHRS